MPEPEPEPKNLGERSFVSNKEWEKVWHQHVLFISDREGPGYGKEDYERIQKKYEELIRSYEGRSIEGNWKIGDGLITTDGVIIIKIKKIKNALKPCPDRYVNVLFTCVPEYEVIVTYEGKKNKLKYDQLQRQKDLQRDLRFTEKGFSIILNIKAYSDGVKGFRLEILDVDKRTVEGISCHAIGYQKETLYCAISGESVISTTLIKISSTSSQKR